MSELAPLIYDLAVMLGLAGIVVLLFQRIRQPVVLGYLVAGMIVGPYTPPHALVKDMSNIHILSELGVIFLMFSLGLEFSFQKLTRVGFSASVTGVIEVILMIMMGYATGLLMGWSTNDCLFLGAALSISSTTIIIKAIDELGLKTKRFAELIFGVLIVEDLLAILLLVALSTIIISRNAMTTDILYASGRLILVVGGWFLVGYFLVPPLFRKISPYISQETLTIISVALCLTLVCLAANFNYSTALGAFIMGSILAETVLIRRIEILIRPIRDIFAAVFFISVGMLINPLVIFEHWPTVLLLSLVTIVGKIFTTSIAALLTGQSPTTSIKVGFSMAQIGEFSFIIAGLGLALNATSETLYPLIVAVSGITTFTTPYLIRLAVRFGPSLETYLPERVHVSLQTYATWVNQFKTLHPKHTWFRIVFTRFIINGIIIAIIFKLAHDFIFIHFATTTSFDMVMNRTGLFLVLFLSAPFIWGMLFSYSQIASAHKEKYFPFIITLIWVITLSELLILSRIYFQTWMIVILSLLIMAILFICFFRYLETSYHWFEKRLLTNIQSKRKDKANSYDHSQDIY